MSIIILGLILLGMLMILGGTPEGFYIGTIMVVLMFAIILI